MNINIEQFTIPIITVGCFCVGFVLKKWMPTDDRWIPTILLILGAVSGIVLLGFTYEGVVKGMVSGLASVGVHQAFKQFLKEKADGSELDDEEADLGDEDYEEGDEDDE